MERRVRARNPTAVDPVSTPAAARCPRLAWMWYTALNVLEHIEDDQAALNQMARVLKPAVWPTSRSAAHPILIRIYDK
jgi:hypothetical protein